MLLKCNEKMINYITDISSRELESVFAYVKQFISTDFQLQRSWKSLASPVNIRQSGEVQKYVYGDDFYHPRSNYEVSVTALSKGIRSQYRLTQKKQFFWCFTDFESIFTHLLQRLNRLMKENVERRYISKDVQIGLISLT